MSLMQITNSKVIINFKILKGQGPYNCTYIYIDFNRRLKQVNRGRLRKERAGCATKVRTPQGCMRVRRLCVRTCTLIYDIATCQTQLQ